MTALPRFTLSCFVLILVAGCTAGIKGRADRPTYLATSTSYYASDIKAALNEAAGFKKLYYCMRGVNTSDAQSGTATASCTGVTNTSPQQLLAVRNDYAYKMLQAHELALQDYARSLSVEGRGGAFATTLAVLGLSAASTIISNSSTQSILSGISTGLLGARESYSREVLADKAVDFVLIRITAAHLHERAKIFARLSEDPLTYPLSALELDLENLSRVSSFEVALSGIAASVEQTLNNAEEEVEFKRSFTFSGNKFTPIMDHWLDVSDETEFARRVQAGKDWLTANNVKGDKDQIVDLFVFISSAEMYGDKYEKFVDEVVLK